MPPSDPPTNDNRGPREPIVLSPRGKRIELAVSIVGLIAGAICIWLFATSATLRAIGVGLVVVFVGAFIAAGVRWVLTGRA